MIPKTDEDIHALLVHYPALTIGEYAKMFNCSEPPKVQSELSKQLEVAVLTYQASFNEAQKKEEQKKRERRERRESYKQKTARQIKAENETDIFGHYKFKSNGKVRIFPQYLPLGR